MLDGKKKKDEFPLQDVRQEPGAALIFLGCIVDFLIPIPFLASRFLQGFFAHTSSRWLVTLRNDYRCARLMSCRPACRNLYDFWPSVSLCLVPIMLVLGFWLDDGPVCRTIWFPRHWAWAVVSSLPFYCTNLTIVLAGTIEEIELFPSCDLEFIWTGLYKAFAAAAGKYGGA